MGTPGCHEVDVKLAFRNIVEQFGWIATAIPFRSVIFPGPAGADITEPASVTERHGDERETRAKKEVRRARTRTARTTYDRLGRHTTTYDDRESVLFLAYKS